MRGERDGIFTSRFGRAFAFGQGHHRLPDICVVMGPRPTEPVLTVLMTDGETKPVDGILRAGDIEVPMSELYDS